MHAACMPDLDVVDVGYRFLPQYWGRGLASEACMASLDFGFNELGLEQIVAFVLPGNAASVRVLEKTGMHSDGEFVYDGRSAMRYVRRRVPADDDCVSRSGDTGAA